MIRCLQIGRISRVRLEFMRKDAPNGERTFQNHPKFIPRTESANRERDSMHSRASFADARRALSVWTSHSRSAVGDHNRVTASLARPGMASPSKMLSVRLANRN